MRTAIFADLHDNYTALTAVLDDAATHKVDRMIFLGDAGHSPRLLAALRVRKIPCVFGNWEVSGLRRWHADLATWVGAWPAVMLERSAVYCHATPDMPAALATTSATAAWMKPGASWSAIFPRLHQNMDALWNALAWMETAGVTVAFHGHTHVQMVWTWELATNQLRSFTNLSQVRLAPGTRTIIGVGSAGVPEDGPWPRYAIYDEVTATVLLRVLHDVHA
ncbi:MAG TPA: hypothetical protein DCL15_10445 [Chloroflexi bacterium]|nr:hypothetical protein [Chloroflexota bacterium]HHW84708.1 metallophosphoesterase family protein [Chloroflexota bacterium]